MIPRSLTVQQRVARTWFSTMGGVLLAVSSSLLAGMSFGREAAAYEAPKPVVEMVRMGGARSYSFEGLAPEPGSYALPPITRAADGAVVLSDGEASTLHEIFGDKLVLLSFVFTRCADVCPMATGVLHRVHGEIAKAPELASRLRLVTFSFDPERDTPETMARYGKIAGDDGDWVFLTTRSRQSLMPTLEAYDQHVTRDYDATGKSTGDFSHILRIYLIDGKKRIRNIYSASYLYPELVLADVRTLLLEERNKGVAGRTAARRSEE